MRRSAKLLSSMTPFAWSEAPEGWHMYPSTSVEIGRENNVQKLFCFLKQNSQYMILGEAMAFAEEIGCIPKIEWFYSDLTVTVPPTPAGEKLALFLNDQERIRGNVRNQSSSTSSSNTLWSPQLLARLQTKSDEDFCWCLTDDTNRTQQFMQETYLQWHNRADYLISRKSREKREFRPDITLNQVILNGQERKRRMQQRKLKEEEQLQLTKDEKHSDWDNFVADVLPREIRENLDKESDGMDDVRYSRTGATNGSFGRSNRTPGFGR
ncbi:Hypothetical protein, putative [Bodo saltans]|uniref:Uncharacterized protein n=1 Tax=Bodo saltans TaxID=75058 RepID=A0A0S4JQ00_BODSA|nr:Hypothetical protein, putative [Bodo saltans]|eukprot:CUG91157.1 Hypothetical protein, putative [Bodo saltans]